MLRSALMIIGFLSVIAIGYAMPKDSAPCFQLFLTDSPDSPDGFDSLSRATPLITNDDIDSCLFRPDVHSFTIYLKTESVRRIYENKKFRISVWGLPFVVAIDGKNLFEGRFWTILSSYMPPEIILAGIDNENELSFGSNFSHDPDSTTIFHPDLVKCLGK